MGLNHWGIDENAQTWYLALKYHLPTSRQSNGLPILGQYQTFTEESSKIFLCGFLMANNLILHH